MELKDGAGYAIALPLIDNHTFRATLRPPRYVTLYYILVFPLFFVGVVFERCGVEEVKKVSLLLLGFSGLRYFTSSSTFFSLPQTETKKN